MAGKQILPGTVNGRFFLVFVVCLLIQPFIYSQQPDLNFEHFSVDNEVAEPNVNWITQDSEGYLWFSCDQLISRHDGYSFVTYTHDPEDTLNTDISFTVPYEDKEGNFWIGTSKGLEKLDRSTGKFTRYIPDHSGSVNNKSNSVLSLCEDKNGTLWVGTKNGLYKFDKSAKKFTRFVYDGSDPGSICNNEIRAFYEDEHGEMWFGTAGGLDKLDFRTGKFKHYWNDPDNRYKTADNSSKYWINEICGDKSGTIWMATNWGIVEYNRSSGIINNYLPNPDTRPEDIPNHVDIINNNNITSICKDNRGILWAGTVTGLYGFDAKSKSFLYHYVHNEDKPRSISHNTVVSLYAERSGTIWAGTYSGLNKFSPIKKIYGINFPEGFFHYMRAVDNKLLIRMSNGWYQLDNIAKTFVPYFTGTDKFYAFDNSGNMWFRDEKGNLYKRDINGNNTYCYTPSGKKFDAPIAYAYQGTRGIWIGAHQGFGLNIIDTSTLVISEVTNLERSIHLIYEDSLGFLWVVQAGGYLAYYDQEKDTLIEISSDSKLPGSIKSLYVTKIIQDKKGRLWFATDKGLNRYDHSTGKFIYYPEKSVSSDENIINMLEDDHGCLWLGKTRTITKFDPEKNLFHNFNVPSNFKMAWGALRADKTADGEMFFGGRNGVIHFYPDSLKINSFIPPIVVTSFRKFDKPSPIEQEIHLFYDENFISFEFSALSYIHNEKNQYAYMMEGLDKDWIYSGIRRYASYTNINPGKYIFKVKGSNNDGVWSEKGTSLLIFISPPWWKTIWAYILYSIILLGIIYFTWKLQLNRIKMRHAYEMSRFEAEKLSELDELKSRFFANLSHEFRTPLTLILGPVKQLIEKTKDENTRNKLHVIRRNADRLLGMVNQLLDISKLESGNMKLKAAPRKIIPFLKALTFAFASYAERKRMTLNFNSSDEDIIAYIDKDKFEKIINNLLSNAFKYTPEGGQIDILVRTTSLSDQISPDLKREIAYQGKSTADEYIEIEVRDTGIGIPEDKIPRIFDRFYQVDGSQVREYEGTGIGLALTRELIELHKGTIRVRSAEGKGTIFTIYIPLGKNHLNPEEIIAPVKVEENVTGSISEDIYVEESTERTDPVLVTEKEKQILLIVEDNSDVRNYMKENLKEEYSIIEAADGEEGLDKSLDHIPDLVISDVMMPKMDGFELCKKIKGDEQTSHIPVIMLTAKAGVSDKIGGYETGADDYIKKPFDIEELKARIRNLIEQRERIHEYFRKHGIIELEMPDITSTDKKYLQKAFEIINRNISDPVFGIESLSELIGTSRSVLHRKITSLTGESPGELIRRIRLKKASQLIEQNFGNISEIALEVGFSNPSQFTRSFRKQFGISPSEYQQNHKNKSR